ncbi:MAG TPA: hypothetical protein VMT24_07005 [Aggregatilineaceae bacterium]|nr:hypothetical protein [Aggregatilineaceae bacterium]
MIAKWLVRAYPQAWRARYEDEFLALMAERPFALADVADIARGALDAHLHPELIPGRGTAMPSRTAILTIFCAYIAFVLAGLTFYGTVDDSPFVAAMHDHTALNAAWDVLAAGSAVALLAVVIGGLPVALAVFRHARAASRGNLTLLAIPAVVLTVWVVYTVILGISNLDAASKATRTALQAIWMGLFVAGAVASTAAVCLAVLRSEIGEQRIRVNGVDLTVQPDRFVIVPAVITILAMGVMLIAAISWVILARSAAPEAFNGAWGFFSAPTRLTLLGSVALMAISTAIAASAARGLAGPRPMSQHAG